MWYVIVAHGPTEKVLGEYMSERSAYSAVFHKWRPMYHPWRIIIKYLDV